MKHQLEQLIQSDTSYNRSATKSLFRTHPDLWRQIVEKTAFLPETAKPKQRVWHILNDVWDIPRCPITGEPVKWHENRYLMTKDRRARRKLQDLRGDLKHCYTPEINKKRSDGNKRSWRSGARKYTPLTQQQQLERTAKSKQTFLKKYGVDNPSRLPAVKRKISEAQIRNGATPPEQRGLRRLYYEAVWRFTQQSWRNHFDQINPQRLDRSQLALDHIFSIQEGFNQRVPACWLGHWTNLRLIAVEDNSRKGMGCDKTLDQLIADAQSDNSVSYPVSLNTNSQRQRERYQQGVHNFVGLARKKLLDGTSALLTQHQCPHCGKTGQGPVMFRHHFDRCSNQ